MVRPIQDGVKFNTIVLHSWPQGTDGDGEITIVVPLEIDMRHRIFGTCLCGQHISEVVRQLNLVFLLESRDAAVGIGQ